MRQDRLLLLALVLVLAGCSAAPYKEFNEKDAVGYRSYPQKNGYHTVLFSGNEHTSSTQAYDFCLLRSAEVAKQHNYEFFVLLLAENCSESISTSAPTHSNEPVSKPPEIFKEEYSKNKASTIPFRNHATSHIKIPKFQFLIKLVHSRKEAGLRPEYVHETETTITKLKAKYRIK